VQVLHGEAQEVQHGLDQRRHKSGRQQGPPHQQQPVSNWLATNNTPKMIVRLSMNSTPCSERLNNGCLACPVLQTGISFGRR
jgi:hypothetical protein